MGFNKRFIKMSSLISVYNYSKIEGVFKYCTNPDALMVSMSDNSRYVVDSIMKGDLDGAELILKYELLNNNNE
jgi:hypothetical protein